MSGPGDLARQRLEDARKGGDTRADDGEHQAAVREHLGKAKLLREMLDGLEKAELPGAKGAQTRAAFKKHLDQEAEMLRAKHHVLWKIQEEVTDQAVRSAFLGIIRGTGDFEEALDAANKLGTMAKDHGLHLNGPLLRQWIRMYYRPDPATVKASKDPAFFSAPSPAGRGPRSRHSGASGSGS